MPNDGLAGAADKGADNDMVVASEERAEQPCRTVTDATMDAAAAGTRARTKTTQLAPNPANTATGKAASASCANNIDQRAR